MNPKKRRKSLIGWTFKGNLSNPNINNLNFYPNQPRIVLGKADEDFIKE